MKREELKAVDYETIYANRPNGNMLFYTAAEADKVLDDYENRNIELDEDYRKISEMYIAEQTKAAKYEQRIKELENKNRNLQYSSDMWMACCKLMSEGKRNVMSSDAIAEIRRIKELEAENERLHMANIDNLAHFNTLKEDYEKLKATISILENNKKENL